MPDKWDPSQKPKAEIVNIQDARDRLEKGGETKQGIDYFLEVLKSNPKNINALLNLGMIFIEGSKTEKAREYLTRAVEADPSFALAWYNLGLVHDDLSEKDKAEECYEKAIKCNESYADAYFNLAILLEQKKKYFTAINNYKKYLEYCDKTDKARRLAIEEIDKLKKFIEEDSKKNTTRSF